jgi:hypothetical protein
MRIIKKRFKQPEISKIWKICIKNHFFRSIELNLVYLIYFATDFYNNTNQMATKID